MSDPEKKPLSRAQQRRRADLIEAGLEIFDKDGYEAARIADITKAAEVAKGTFYLYFDNKEALLRAAVEQIVLPKVNSMSSIAAEQQGSATEILRRLLTVLSDNWNRPNMKVLLRILIAEGQKHDDLRRFYWETIVNPGIQTVQNVLAYGVQQQEFRDGIQKISPQTIIGSLFMGTIWQMMFANISDIDQQKLIDDQMDMLLNGIC